MMAAAEARAAWQRTANRCFVQEDAKRAPKLACCPPPQSNSSKQVDSVPASIVDGSQPEPEHPASNFTPLRRNPSNSNLASETKWWLHLQPNFAYQKGFCHEPLKPNEPDVESVVEKKCFMNTHSKVSSTCLNKNSEVIKQEQKVVNGVKEDKELCFDSDSPWIGTQKIEPWWRVADRDELASLVARRSLDPIENCDLPRPQSTHIRKNPFVQSRCLDHERMTAFSLDRTMDTGLPNHSVRARANIGSGKPCGREGHLKCLPEKPPSCDSERKAITETEKATENDPSKAQLLEALRHSQTRAREAEKAAKQAHAEKEHIIQLFFRQASHLFAYKQWFQLLQLETFYIKLNSKLDPPDSTPFPVVLPWTPLKARKLKKSRQSRQNGAREIPGTWGRPRFDVSNHVLAFALGLSLVGAGLVLGWTVGWMLPSL